MIDETLARVVYACVGLATLGMLLDFLSDSFTVGPGFWGFLSVVMGFLTGAVAVKRNRNGNGNGNTKG